MAQPFNFDVAGTISQQMQGSNALGDLGRFMLQKKQVDFQQAQARAQDARLKAQEDEKKRMAEATRAAMLGALTKDQEVPVFGEEEYADGSVQAPDISAMMMGMGGQNLSARGIDVDLPREISDTMLGRETVPEPVRWELPKSPVDVMRKRQIQVGTKTEKVPNENWMSDASRAVAGVDPELAINLAKGAASIASNSERASNTVEFKLQSAINSLNDTLNDPSATGDDKRNARKLVGLLQKEITSADPSLKNAYEQFYNGEPTAGAVASTAAEQSAAPATGSMESLDAANTTITNRMSGVKYKGKTLDSLVNEITATIDRSGMSQEDKDTAKRNLAMQAGQKGGAPGAPTESKDEFTAWKQGFDASASSKGLTAGMALGQAMKSTLEDAVNSGAKELDLSNSQKLAALVYQTYNPGTLVAGEMASAVNAAKDAGAVTRGLEFIKSKWNVNSNTIPIEKALKIYNESLTQGSTAYSEIKKSLGERAKGGKKLPLTDTYFSSFNNPQNYAVRAKSKESTTPGSLKGKLTKDPKTGALIFIK